MYKIIQKRINALKCRRDELSDMDIEEIVQLNLRISALEIQMKKYQND
jgi:hypothetical protein